MVNKARCPKCNQEITKSDKFCSNCGAKVTPSQNSNHKNANFKQRKFICKNCKKDIPVLDNNETKILCPYCGEINLRKSRAGRISTIMKTTIIFFILIAIISIFSDKTKTNSTPTNSSINPEVTQVSSMNSTNSKVPAIDDTSLQENISIARQKIPTVPEYNIFSTKGTANIFLNDRSISNEDLAYISSVYIKLYTQSDKIEKLFINYYFPGMNTNESSLAVASWDIKKSDKFSLSGSINDYSNTEHDLNKIEFNGWSSAISNNSLKIKPKTVEEQYNTIKDTPDFKAYISFKEQISNDKELGVYNPFQEDPEYDRKYSQLKPKYNRIVSEKYNVNFDIDGFEEKNPNHIKLLQYHRETENIIRNAYLKKQYETLKSNQLFHAYIVEYPKLVSSQLPEIDSEIERQLGKPPIDQTKNKKYIEEYQKLDKYLWNQARINCAKQISKKYNLKFNINEIEQQNPEWKEISTWYANEQYELNEEAKKQALEEFDKQFSGWDGSNRYVEKAIKSALNDPSSYEHHQTFRYINENSDNKKLHVITRFRAKNGFGALMMNRAECDIDLSGNISNLKIQPGF